jgi:hypothetical protein
MTTGPTAPRPPRAPLFSRKREREKRTPTSIAIAVVIHVVAIAALIQLITVSTALQDLLRTRREREMPVERISFLSLPKVEPGQKPTPGRRGGNGIPERPNTKPAEPPKPLVAPSEVPSVLPPAQPNVPPKSTEDEGTGPLVGGGGATRGIRPALSDPRIWSAPSTEVAAAPKTTAQRLDSALMARFAAVQDSVAANTYSPNKFERGDWTTEKNGQKWGIDQKYIRLGKISIPTAILGLLPTQLTGNPQAYERNKQLAAMRAEIQEHAQQAMTEEEFRTAVKRLRERKERERRESEKKGEKTVATPGSSRQ